MLISATGSITATGGNGGTSSGNGGSGGGGAGGSIELTAAQITHDGSLSAAGGIGGLEGQSGATSAGGAGGAGRILLRDGDGVIAGAGGSSPAATALTLPPANPLVINVLALPSASLGNAYSASVAASGGTPGYTYSVGGALPSGLLLNAATGEISGTSMEAAGLTSVFSVTVTDAAAATYTRTFQIRTSTTSLALTTQTLPLLGTPGTPYSAFLTTTGGVAPLAYTLQGTLPAGLSLDSVTGEISGIAETLGESRMFDIVLGDSTAPFPAFDTLSFLIAPPASADLAVSVTANDTIRKVGQTAGFTVGLGSIGPGDSGETLLNLSLDGEAPGMLIVPPAGWACTMPVPDAGSTTASCGASSFGSGSTVMFDLSFPLGDALGGRSLTLSATAIGSASDPVEADNSDSASLQVTSEANLRLAFNGPTIPVRSGVTVPVYLRLDNYGSNAADSPVLTISSGAPLGSITLVAPAGWSCTESSALRASAQQPAVVAVPGAGFSCQYSGYLPRGTSQFRLNTLAPANPPGGFVGFTANIASPTSDPVLTNNAAAYKLFVKASAFAAPVVPGTR